MARLTIDSVTKDFGDFRALDAVSIDVEDGEFLAVLGPSGCGKTTLLRLVAGFEQVSDGEIAIGERRVSGSRLHVPAESRRVGIVFQNYALWPHMTVAQNVGYSLRVAGVPAAERRKRVEEALALVDLAGFDERQPGLLSGGQRQRVALARCLVAAPSLVLLDEPLANLDVHLRGSMEEEFADFHRRTGTTMVYITHDQAEAMALADRIAVLDRGKLMQLATPATLYREPATEMVAAFIGQGMVVPGEVRSASGEGTCMARVLGADVALRCAPGQPIGPASICLRARDLALDSGGVAASVKRVVYRGGYRRTELVPEAAPDLRLFLDLPEAEAVEAGTAVALAIGGGWVIPGAGEGRR